MSSAVCFNFAQSLILPSGNELTRACLSLNATQPNPLPNNKILQGSKFKAFEDKDLYVAKMY